jgi:light-regulated signal transduction histidine kinase (bacteriophytochrome)/CheY-like chemotaxis protein
MNSPLPPGLKIDLTNCEREPIHVLGNIQGFGFLVAVGADWFISRVSANTARFIGVPPDQLLGRALVEVFTEHAVHAIRNRVTLLRGPDAVERLFNVTLMAGGPAFDVALHFSGDQVLIEAEPAMAEEMEASAVVRAMIARVNQTDSFAGFLREGARQVRALTGFDRVMVYRFDDQGSGEVVAEALRPSVDSFMGLHYPASDIPAQARKLYIRNIFRVIADINGEPVPVMPELDARGQPLDQSLSALRAVSPIHIEYLKNMGVGASLSISIVADGKLWGLFACHHNSPRLPSFSYRTAAELFGQMFSLMLESRERRDGAEYETRARAATDRIMATVAQDNSLLENAQWIGDMVFETIPADGVGVCLDGAMSLTGLTPDQEQFGAIVRFLTEKATTQVFATESIQTFLPGAGTYADRSAGMIAIPLSRNPRDYVVLFRSEQLRSVRWAGNPEKPVEYGPHGARLTPRKSFEAWSELVKGQSVPFTSAERRVAETLRIGIMEVLVRLSDIAGAERARAHERQNLLIGELNHRVRNILALIRGLISQSRASAETVEGFIATLDDRIKALARAHDQITADRWGPARLSDLLETEAGAYLGEKRQRVLLEGPGLLINPSAFTSLALVFHELMTNAAKYGALSDSGIVKVRWRQDEGGDLLLDWTEEGGPAVSAPRRRGFGSTIIEQSIPFDLGGTVEMAFPVTGFHAHLRIPARHVAGLAQASETVSAVSRSLDAQPLADRRVLLVEDSMIIALDAEEALKEIGAAKVVTAASVARALGALEKGGLDFALLDLNLGDETSIPVAEALRARGIQFAFATGYGEAAEFVARFPGAPVLTKPYTADDLRKTFTDFSRKL